MTLPIKNLIKCYVGFPHFLRRLQYPHIIRNIAKHSIKGRFLDVGCGGGQLARQLAQYSLTIGINLFDLRYKLPECESKKLYFFPADGLDLPFSKGRFEVIILSSVLQMVRDDTRLLRECWRVMVDNGILVLTVPTGYVYIPYLFSRSKLGKVLRILLRLPDEYEAFKSILKTKHNASGRGWYTVSNLEKCLGNGGFTIESMEFAPRALGTFLYEMSLIIRWASKMDISVAGYLNMVLYPLGWLDSFFAKTSRGCECLVVCIKIRQ